jgi:glutaredoxin
MSVVSKSSQSKIFQKPSCAYCKEDGHYLRASRDQNSAITCPILKEKENRRKEQERQTRKMKKNSIAPMPAIIQNTQKNNLFSELEMEDDVSEVNVAKQVYVPDLATVVQSPSMNRSYGTTNIMDFPDLPSIRPIKLSRESQPERISYASIAAPLTEEPKTPVKPKNPIPEDAYKTPLQETRILVAPNAPMKVKIFPLVRPAPIHTIRKSWADCDSSDDEDEDEEDEKHRINISKQGSWLHGNYAIPVGHSSDW